MSRLITGNVEDGFQAREINFSDNPAVVAAALLGVKPDAESVAYFDQLVVECEGCEKTITLDDADVTILPEMSDGEPRLLVTQGRCYAHVSTLKT